MYLQAFAEKAGSCSVAQGIPKELGRPPLPKVPSIEPKPVLQLGETVAQTEACVGCVFIWEKANAELDQSAGYEAVKDALSALVLVQLQYSTTRVANV